MNDWKLKARTEVKLERTSNMFVSLFLSCLGNLKIWSVLAVSRRSRTREQKIASGISLFT